ncbi:hypothetical protein TcasGA2_TC034539, partial [Tribolium castaneum]
NYKNFSHYACRRSTEYLLPLFQHLQCFFIVTSPPRTQVGHLGPHLWSPFHKFSLWTPHVSFSFFSQQHLLRHSSWSLYHGILLGHLGPQQHNLCHSSWSPYHGILLQAKRMNCPRRIRIFDTARLPHVSVPSSTVKKQALPKLDH